MVDLYEAGNANIMEIRQIHTIRLTINFKSKVI